MEKACMKRLFWATLSLTAVSGCDARKSPPSPAQPSYAIVENGNPILPTNDLSQRLITLSGPDRLESFRGLIVSANHACDVVSSATLAGGLDGTDTWLVRCQACRRLSDAERAIQGTSVGDCKNDRTWAVWFYPNGNQEVTSCQSGNCA